MKRRECLQQARDQRFQRLKSVGLGNEHDHGDRQRGEVLLEFEVLVGGYQNVESSRGFAEQFAVLKARPSFLCDCPDDVTRDDSAKGAR